MSSNDLDRQIELLKFYPEVMEKHFGDALNRAVKLADEEIRPNIPVGMSSRAQRTFRSRVTGMGINLTGQVGWWGRNSAWYINIVEYGAKPHKITSRTPGGFLWFGGRAYQEVQHPGFSARGFMAAGFSAVQPMINAEMKQASEGVVKEMALP